MPDYECKTTSEILALQTKLIDDVVKHLYITKTLARALLITYRWNKNQATDEFLNKGQFGIFDFDPDIAETREIPTECACCYDVLDNTP